MASSNRNSPILKPDWLSQKSFKLNTTNSLQWLYNSLKATNYNGFAAYYEKRPLCKGKWSSAYPETTGYLIETMFDYAELNTDNDLRETAFKVADWLLNVQMKNGAFPSGLIGDEPSPSIFNTGMILFGLERTNREPNNLENKPLDKAMKAASNWLLDSLEENGSWKTGAYVPGYIPSYYTRVLWALLLVDQHIHSPSLKEKVSSALELYQQKITKDYFIEDCGFFPEKPTLSHTLAYCLRGFLECAILLKNEYLYSEIKAISTKLCHLIINKGKVAGEYKDGWVGNYRFVCLTGNAQLSIIFLKLFEKEQNELFYEAAIKAFDPVVKNQCKNNHPDLKGGIPGSLPIWGKYFRFRYPNWGAKFFLEAYMDFYKTSKKMVR